ncbi:MAG: prepilin-type N-terminal cleavage/methylation domain-containing protein [Proteobacteria bacterium]|nr:prepilin-type N-terminal cleavage/methylation domain-containing protein [Pseudomonadota bacterium]
MLKIKQSGFTLIELTISFSLGLILLSALLKVYLNHKQHTLWLTQAAHIQENARAITDIFREYIHHAGYKNFSEVAFNSPIKGYQSFGLTWIPELPHALQGKVKSNTDVFTVHSLISGKLKSNTFFIHETTRKNVHGEFINVLSTLDENGDVTELFENVDSLKVKYLSSPGFRKSDYLLAAEVRDWDQIKAVQIIFSLNTEQNLSLRREWEVYVSLRQSPWA